MTLPVYVAEMSAWLEHMEALGSNERLLAQAIVAFFLAIFLLTLRQPKRPIPRLLLGFGGVLLCLGYLVLFPMSMNGQLSSTPGFQPVSMSLNFGWFCLGAGLLTSIRKHA